MLYFCYQHSMNQAVFAVLLILGLLGCSHAQCEESVASLTIAVCLDTMTPFSMARTNSQRQRGCRGAYQTISCMEEYILTCSHAMSSLDNALEQLGQLRQQRLNLDTFCHRDLETC